MTSSLPCRPTSVRSALKPNNLRESIARAEQTLAGAGIATPGVDARLIAAHLVGVAPLELTFAEVPEGFDADYEELITRRAAREPLQHILGTAPFGSFELAVGPGVFIPRPETELLADWAVHSLIDAPSAPTVIDLGSGTGAIAITIARARPDADVYAVERSAAARVFLERNVADHAPSISIVPGDMTDPALLRQLRGTVDLVVSNPPYVPETTELQQEVYADPHDAVFSGVDGMEAIRGLVPVAARLLRPGGRIAIEHDDSTALAVVETLRACGEFEAIDLHADLAGRARFVTASKVGNHV